jgi:hypothetical protein
MLGLCKNRMGGQVLPKLNHSNSLQWMMSSFPQKKLKRLKKI